MKSCNRTLTIEGIDVLLVRKRVKHLRLVVAPPDGRVRVSVPTYLPDDLVWMFLQERVDWIRDKQEKFAGYVEQVLPQFVSGELHYFFGQSYSLYLIERAGRARVQIQDDRLLLFIGPCSTVEQRGRLLDGFYRAEMKKVVPALLDKWQARIGRSAREWGVKKMKTRWGTCNITRHRIWLNLELAKRPMVALEYVIVHELVHLLERNHNARFRELMTTFMPEWRSYKLALADPPETDPKCGPVPGSLSAVSEL
jgi:predicted metal-dependent hydrolase